MSSEQTWSEAVKASIENADIFVTRASSITQQDTQADFLPTSSQSPGRSPQPSPDSQQKDLPQTQHGTGYSSSSQQDQHISQSAVFTRNISQNYEQPISCDKNNSIDTESLRHHSPAGQQISNKTAPTRYIDQCSSSNYMHCEEFSQQNHQVNSGQANKNASPGMLPFPNKQAELSQNQSFDHHQVHLSTPKQPSQQRLPLNPQHQQSIRMMSPSHSPNMQQVHQNFPCQNPSQQPFLSGGQQQHMQQTQHRMPQHQRPLTPGLSAAANVYQNTRMTISGFNTPTDRPRFKPPLPGHPQAVTSGQFQGSQPVGQNQLQMPVAGHTGHPLTHIKNDGSPESVNKMPQQQGQPQTFPVPHQQGVSYLKQGTEAYDRLPQGSGIHQPGFGEQEVYYDDDDEEDEDDEEMDDMDEEEMEYSGFHGYDYPSGDSDELSEEESALLEELRSCEDDMRYEEILCRLREKGVDPDEIDEILCQSNYSQVGYIGLKYDEDEDEDEGTVSSSSQGTIPCNRNQLKPYASSVPPDEQNPPGACQLPSIAHNQKETSSSRIHSQQMVSAMLSGGFNHQGVPHGVSAVSTEGHNQQGRSSGHQGFSNQSQQQVSDIHPPTSMRTAAQADALHLQQQQQQSQLKFPGQDNHQKKIFQNGPVEIGQLPVQTNSWQPLQNVVRAQHQLRPGDSRQPAPKTVSLPTPSPSMQTQRPIVMNRMPQALPQIQGQPGTARPQGPTQSNLSGVVVRPVQHLTIHSNNQTNMPGQGGQNCPVVVRQTAPVQQLVISSVPVNQDGSIGTPHVPTSAARNLYPQTSFQGQQRAQEGTSGSVSQISGMSANQNVQQQQNLIHSSKLKAALDKDTAPSEASLARLNVMYMQQSLDQEIMARKGTQTASAQSIGQQNLNSQHLSLQNRFSAPQNMKHISPGHPNHLLHLQKQQNQPFPAYQPKHQLPPRQPIPAIVNPNPGAGQTFSGDRPICSVVPFTSQVCGQAATTNVQQRQNTPQQNINFIRPHNPSPSLPQQIGNSPQHSPGTVQSRLSAPAVNPGPLSSPPGPNMAANRNLLQGNITPVVSNQVLPQHAGPDQSQISGSRPEAFNLDHLSEDKCVITGRGKQQGLVVNMVYQIRSPSDNSLVLALWNGEHFEDLKPSDVKALGQLGQVAHGGSQPGQKSALDLQKVQTGQNIQLAVTSDADKKGMSSSTNAGAASKFQTEFLQSLTQKKDEDEQSSSTESQQNPSTSNKLEPVMDTKLLKTSSDVLPSESTYVKPLQQGQPQQKTDPVEEDNDDFIFKKPFSENEDYFRVCQYCGYTSKNFRRCEGCSKVFQGEIKIHCLKKLPAKTSTMSSSPLTKTSDPKSAGSGAKDAVTRKKGAAGQFLNNVSHSGITNVRGRGRGARGRSGRTKGGGLKGRMGARGASGEGTDSDDSSLDGKRNSDGSGNSSDTSSKRRPARTKSKNPTPRKRSKKTDEPVTVTISSDEDEPTSTSNSMSGLAPSPANSAGSESPIFPSTPTDPINAFGRFRRVRMEDEEGNSKLSKKMQLQLVAPLMNRHEEDEDDEDDEDEDGDEPPTYEIDIRSVRIGSMRTQPEGPLLISLQGVCFKVRSERTEEAFECEILAQEVEQVKYFSGQTQPVLFLFLTPECGAHLRSICHMQPGDDEYFDPSSTDMKQKMVVIIIECFSFVPHEMLRETLSLWADLNHVEDEHFIEELTEESANDLLIQSAPPVLTADVERDIVKFKRRYLRDTNSMPLVPRIPGSPSDSTDNEPDSTSSSPPENKYCFGSSIRLLQYPPPPARGLAITTEDLFCLTEGEFLNDVIIDFYLQFLYQEKLSEEDRKRTHIFSSFFYKRLTQRDRHSEKTEEDAKKTVQERRHARVKKWTKTVDLFSKDFIIVPINEHSHWYLAVICFPGLANSEVVPFIPSSTHKGDVDDESNENTGEERTNEENGNQDTLPKTILGRQLDARKCLDSEDSKYNLGQKQPCILMFDSLAGPSRSPNVRMLRDYLQCEWNAKKSEARQITKILRSSTPKVPQQSNYSDCGVYLLQYVESFFEDPIADFQIPMKGLQNWFPEEVVHNKRREIHDLIMSLHRRFQEERGDPRILEIKFESAPRDSLMKLHPGMEIMNSKLEEGMGPGSSRDDDSSSSSFSGEMTRSSERTSLASRSVEDNSSMEALGPQGSQQGSVQQKYSEEQSESEDQDSNKYESANEKQETSHQE